VLALWCPGLLADSDIEAQVSARTLAHGQPVELTLTARGDRVDGPDLSVLEPDFQILDRRVERRFAIRNGQRSAQLRLSLLLLPRRDGTLILPAIPFGEASSEPLTLTVAPDTGAPAEAPGAAPFPPSAAGIPGQPEPGWGGRWPGFAPFQPVPGPGLAPVPPIDLTPGGLDSLASPESTQRRPAAASPGIARNPWFWISLGLAGALAALLVKRRRVPSGGDPVAPAEPAPQPTGASPLDPALDAVRAAYGSGNAAAARDALLAWARLRWPADPPGNLARLAQRCPQPLRERITRLEMAFFSPDPIPWEQEPVAQALAELEDGRSGA